MAEGHGAGQVRPALRPPRLPARDPEPDLLEPDGWLRFLDDPVTALAPWFAFSFLLDEIGFLAASLLALVLSTALVVAARMRGEQAKAFEVSDAVLFAGIVVVALLRDPGSQTWLADHADAVSNIGLTLVAGISLAVGRPFTAPYTEARFGGADRDLLTRLDRWSTLIWGAGLLVASVVTAYGEWVLGQPDNLWTGWILQTLPLIAALDLTLWIDKRAIAHASDEPWLEPPPVMLARDLLAWLVPSGAASLVFDGGPAWLGWSLIAVGAVGTAIAWFRLDRERAERLAARPADRAPTRPGR